VCGDALSGCEAGPTPAFLGATLLVSQRLAEKHFSRLRPLSPSALALQAAAGGAGSKPIGLLKAAASSRFAAAHHRSVAQPPQHVTRHDR
jgi:hypothetical protein